MRHLVSLTTAEERLDMRSASQIVALDEAHFERHRPDAHWGVLDGDALTARCSLWWSATPPYGGHRVGVVGHYAAQDADSADVLLGHAGRQLAGKGCTIAIGPMDGNTWRPYRLITESGPEPRFFLEPDNPPEWPADFLRNGFEPLARYFSALCSDLSREDPQLAGWAARMAAQGVSVRSLDAARLDDDLRAIHGLAKSAFRNNPLYCDLDEAEFLSEGRALAAQIPLELNLIAEHEGRAVGFVFAVPDLLEHQRGEAVRTAVIKTLAVLPGRRYAGLGQVLLVRLHRRARELGLTRVIHALSRDAGNLRRMSGRYAVPIRRYTLFAKPLS